MRVLIEFRASSADEAKAIRRGATEATAMTADVRFTLDPAYEPVQVPLPIAPEPGATRYALGQPLEYAFDAEDGRFVIRGTIPDADAENRALAIVAANPAVTGVFSDPLVSTMPTCGGSPPVGDADNVTELLGVLELMQRGLDGSGVQVAVVDTGVSMTFLQSREREPKLNVEASWTPANVPTGPGEHAPAHGTMCAYDVGLAAPNATLLDHAVLLSTRPGGSQMDGLLSDAVASYDRLRDLHRGSTTPAPLVITNSWGLYSPEWDFPVGHPSNYTDNPRHPFNIIVAGLEALGADILFAAGNCGRDCPAGLCAFADRSIVGANSHPRVLSVAGVDVRKQRVGYSSQGPGRLDANKPDISAYTHFAGSGIREADTGTSAACPVAAGVIAALRTRYPASVIKPAELRTLLFKTAEDLGGVGFDFDHGWGLINVEALLGGLERLAEIRQVSDERSAGQAVQATP